MLKVIIADDEARVCSLIRMLIDWDALGMELAGVASNGFEALELIRARQPDILITDIRMPGCHGLELIERAKAFDPQLEIAIISGYAHFEYAQSAIRFGVGDYLLKPINQQELMGTLRKLGERCLSRKRLGSEMEQLRISSREDKRQLHERLMQDIMENPSLTLTDDILWDRYRFRAQEGLWQAALLIMDYDAQDTAAASVRIAEEKAAKALASELSAVCHTLITHAQDGSCGALLGFAPAQEGEVRKRLRLCLNQLNVKGGLIGSMEFTMALSGPVRAVQEAPAACAQAQTLLYERLTQGAGRLIEREAYGSGVASGTLLRRYRQAVGEPAERLNPSAVAEIVEQLRTDAAGLPGLRGEEAYGLVMAAGRILLQRPEIENREEKERTFAAQLTHIGCMDTLFDALTQMTVQEMNAIAEQQRSAQTRPIRMACEYVQRHYSEPITLERVCREIGFSVSYFSAFFKKETGESFVRYLTRIRMEHAKELLARTNLPVSQICTQVGYNDLKHFNQTFRKETDLSPGQYRKLYG